MLLCIAGVLSSADAAEACGRLLEAAYRDGRLTAGAEARLVKRNLQIVPEDETGKALKTLLSERVEKNAVFRLAARPKRLSPIILNRYDEGMGYGSHVDDAMMAGLRTDVAFTLFLSAPESYDGGALVIEGTNGEESFKLAAGTLVLYPATSLHHVETVTRGTRLAAVGWAESFVRDTERRAILFDLDTARHALFKAQGKTEVGDLLSKCSSNLLRQWAET